jgi:hypothetical protein
LIKKDGLRAVFFICKKDKWILEGKIDADLSDFVKRLNYLNLDLITDQSDFIWIQTDSIAVQGDSIRIQTDLIAIQSLRLITKSENIP